MSSTHSAQPGLLQRIVDELSVWWRVLARKTDGQEHVWVAIHDSEPKVGPAPPRPDEKRARCFLTEPSRAMTGRSPLTTGTAPAHIESASLSTWRSTIGSRKVNGCQLRSTWAGFGAFQMRRAGNYPPLCAGTFFPPESACVPSSPR
ncbi:hypothetical protein EDD22DRAFT_963486 [Suillus occidentalis]|nr:hypothetical protein EDD22DRAFT_963486 [Suillus occidentalis]